jgi:transcription factor IIIB subunit 2
MTTCLHPESITDAQLGHTICTLCGAVLEENQVVAEVTFSEKSNGAAVSEGFFIGVGQGKSQGF